MVPKAPTTQTSLAPLPHTAEREYSVLLGTLVQVLPFQCRMVPGSPTAQTSLAPLPQTPARGFPCGKGFRQRHSPAPQMAVAVRDWTVTFTSITWTSKAD